MKLSLDLRTSLTQTLTPQQIQYLKMLQLPLIQLEQYLQQEIEQNPMLEDANNPEIDVFDYDDDSSVIKEPECEIFESFHDSDGDVWFDDSHASGLLEYPHYTRPAEYRGWRVPEVLVSGDHGKLAKWRREQALLRTWQRRPDLLATAPLSEADRKFLKKLSEDESG